MAYKLGIVADKYDDHELIGEIARIFTQKGVDYVFHLGSQLSPFLSPAFKHVHVDYGESDYYQEELEVPPITEFNRKMESLGLVYSKDYFEFEAEGLLFLVYDGQNPQITAAMEQASWHDAFISGATTGPVIEYIEGREILRPRARTDLGKEVLAITYHLSDFVPEYIEME